MQVIYKTATAVLLMSRLSGPYTFLLKLYADSGYQGPKFQNGLKCVWREINVDPRDAAKAPSEQQVIPD